MSDSQKDVGFTERLKATIGSQSIRKFARACGMSDTVLRQYLAGKSEPTRLPLIAIARTAGVRLEWLMTGRGDEFLEIDENLLALIMEVIEERAAGLKKKSTLREKVFEICDLYTVIYNEPAAEKQTKQSVQETFFAIENILNLLGTADDARAKRLKRMLSRSLSTVYPKAEAELIIDELMADMAQRKLILREREKKK